MLPPTTQTQFHVSASEPHQFEGDLAMLSRRSHRSANAPPSSPNSRVGTCPAATTNAMACGSRVSPAAISDSAGPRSASPNRDTTAAVHMRQYAAPRPAATDVLTELVAVTRDSRPQASDTFLPVQRNGPA